MSAVRFEDDTPVAEALRADLATPDPDRRAASVGRAGREGGARCVPLLAGALSDVEPRVRVEAALALVTLGERSRDHGDPPPDAFAVAVDAAIRAVADRVPEVRRAAIELLSLVAGEAGRAWFVAALGDENAGVRVEAVRALWRVGGPDAAQSVRGSLGDADPLVRYYAVLAVDELDPPGAAEDLARLLADRRVEVAAEAAFRLAERGDRRAVPVLCRTLRHPDLGFEAARLLGELADPAAGPALRAYVSRWLADPLTRLQAAAALCRMGDGTGEAILLRALRSWRRPVRGFAIELLSGLRSAAAYDSILAVAGRPADYHCGTAARALGRYGDPRGAEALCALLEGHPDPEVRQDAARALGEIGGPLAARALERASLSDRDDAVRDAARAAARCAHP